MSVEIKADLLDGRLSLGGERRPAAGGALSPDLNPSTGEPFAEVAESGEQDVDAAVAAASAAHATGVWRSLPVLERQRILAGIATRLRERTIELARLVARESGMPLSAARFIEIPMAADAFDYFAAAGTLVHGRTLPFSLQGATTRYMTWTQKQPVGVAALITPWNFPLLMPAWKVAACLAAGATAILKPAPETPLVALALADAAREAGLPEGVLSVLPGGDAVGAALVRHPKVAKIALTGNTETGRVVAAEAARSLKRVSLELGGKSPNIVFADANLDDAVSGALFGIFFNSGQVCQAGSRVLVQRPLYERFVEAVVERAGDLIVGDAEDQMTDLGPLVSHAQYGRVAGYVTKAVDSGLRPVLGGAQQREAGGYFFQPTVFRDVEPGSGIAQEEIFGPVAAIMPFDRDEEALEIANGTMYGLAAAVWTQDVRRALRFSQQLDAGTIWLNAYQVLTPTAPFGGFKQSGYGRDLGVEGVEAFLETKTVIADLNDQPMQYF